MFGKDTRPLCPLLQKPCIESGCKFWVMVIGKNPQTDEVINRYDCSFVWNSMLLMENTKVQLQTGAAIESFRNEMVKGGAAGLRLAAAAVAAQLPASVPSELRVVGETKQGGANGN